MKNRVWHPATMKIDGDKVDRHRAGREVARTAFPMAPAASASSPNLYNQALLPTTPFIYYDHKLVTSKTGRTSR